MASAPRGAGATEEAEGQVSATAPQPLSPRERVPEGRVRADAPPNATATEESEGPVSASAPPTSPEHGSDPGSGPTAAGMSHAPPSPGATVATPPTAAATIWGLRPDKSGLDPRHPEAASKSGSNSWPIPKDSGALPASTDLTVAEAVGAPDRVGFPDPPSSAPGVTMPTEDRGALPPSGGLAVEETASAPDRVGFPDPPSSAPAVTMPTEDRRALPSTTGLAVAEVAGASDRVGFPDPPSSAPTVTTQTEDRGALLASGGLAVAKAVSAPDRIGFPDPPSSAPTVTRQTDDRGRVTPYDPGTDGRRPPGQSVPNAPAVRRSEHQSWCVMGPSPPLRSSQAAAQSIPDGHQATRVPPDRSPPAVRGAPP
jgi:hypothetical protein